MAIHVLHMLDGETSEEWEQEVDEGQVVGTFDVAQKLPSGGHSLGGIVEGVTVGDGGGGSGGGLGWRVVAAATMGGGNGGWGWLVVVVDGGMAMVGGGQRWRWVEATSGGKLTVVGGGDGWWRLRWPWWRQRWWSAAAAEGDDGSGGW
ncbi:glycine-rich cell wall structural protein-like [Helianthus annuus]|uniref:glycine-rich cell wall structural protein-like n=1 Tax=Helianthus annuus TaxID=4232 RepID=UPI000B906ACD|nr:glycine-rich cell wall structural protein-like [Helianthus annuus]